MEVPHLALKSSSYAELSMTFNVITSRSVLRSRLHDSKTFILRLVVRHAPFLNRSNWLSWRCMKKVGAASFVKYKKTFHLPAVASSIVGCNSRRPGECRWRNSVCPPWLVFFFFFPLSSSPASALHMWKGRGYLWQWVLLLFFSCKRLYHGYLLSRTLLGTVNQTQLDLKFKGVRAVWFLLRRQQSQLPEKALL